MEGGLRMRYTTRDLTTIAVFAALWGIVEISIGALLKSLNVPMGGAILAGIGMIILLIGRFFVPRRGSTLFIGIITMLLKLFSLGGVVLGPMIGIFAEALIAEITLSAWKRPKLLTFLLAGALSVFWTLWQPFVTGLLFFGRDPFVVWLDMIDRGSGLLGINANAVFVILIILIVLHLAVGCVAGWIAWTAGSRLLDRIRSEGSN
jgi:hypothetical protein